MFQYNSIIQLITFLCSNLVPLITVNEKLKTEQVHGFAYHYTPLEKSAQRDQSHWFYSYFEDQRVTNPYLRYINNQNLRLSTPASNQAKKNFDNLFDNRQIPRIWNDFTALNHDLTTSQLSSRVTLNVDWNQLYEQARISEQQMISCDQLLLRFYNIISHLYHRERILQLVQKIHFLSQMKSIGLSLYHADNITLSFVFNRLFANESFIDRQYTAHRWISNSLIVSTIHEYAHALLRYAENDDIQRKLFNSLPHPQPYNSYINSFSGEPYSDSNSIKSNYFHDSTSTLINYLNMKLQPTEHDEVKLLIAPLLVIGSSYSHEAWRKNSVSEREELLAEAFVYWLTADAYTRDYRWELLNNFFMDYLPNFYHLN